MSFHGFDAALAPAATPDDWTGGRDAHDRVAELSPRLSLGKIWATNYKSLILN